MKRVQRGKSKTGYKKAKTNAGTMSQGFKVPRSIVPTASGVPTKLDVRHKYSFSTSLSSAPLQSFNVSCNGMFDPAGASGQPLYFDEMAAMYTKFVVNSSLIQVTAVVQGSNIPTAVGLLQRETSSGLTSIFSSFAQPGVKTRTSTLYSAPVVLATKYFARENSGAALMNDSTQIGTNSTNPSDTSRFTVFKAPLDLVSTPDVLFQINIWYNATWFEPRFLNDSS